MKNKQLSNTIIVSGLILIFINPIIIGQATGDHKEDFLFGEFYLEQQQYSKALPFYLSALEYNTTSCNFNYRVGQCYMNILGENEKALEYLENAVKIVDPNFVPGRFKTTVAPPHAWLLLGDVYLLHNRLEDASRAYHKYKTYIPEGNKKEIEFITKKIIGIGISYEYQRHKADISLQNMGSTINSRFSDYNPVVSGDLKTLVFTSYWDSFDRIMVSYRTKNEWSTPIEINDELKSDGYCYTAALSYDGNTLYLIKTINPYNSDIYFSNKVDGIWQPMKALDNKINSSHRESSASISKDGNTLYFSTNKPGGEGGFDIYKANKEGDSWKNVKNLGKAINTKYDEEAPYINASGTKLYFSSNGHESIGRMDFMFSSLDENNNWLRPKNLGLPYNTTGDDVFIVYFDDTQTAFFSRELADGLGKLDIYIIQVGDWPDEWDEFADDSITIANADSILSSRNIKNKNSEEPFLSYEQYPDHLSSPTELVEVSEISVTASSNTPSTKTIVTITSSDEVVAHDNELQAGPALNNDNVHAVDAISSAPNVSGNNLLLAANDKVGTAERTNNKIIDNTQVSVSPQTTEKKNKIVSPKIESTSAPSIYESVEKANDVREETSVALANSVYTIQFIALKEPKPEAFFANFDNLVVSVGTDGLYRYTVGEYNSVELALEDIDSIKSLGFVDAFIRNIELINNYNKQ